MSDRGTAAVEFVDECAIYVQGGAGGNGVVSFRREAHVPRGGPDGGDGGRGGDVILVADRNITSLVDLHRHPHRRAERGGNGEGNNRTGADGDDLIVRVPLGTVVRDRDSGAIVADLTADGQRHVIARGGRGGRGNAAFANAQRRVPRFSEFGEETDERALRLELKVIADVGLVGYPSAGKSSLIAKLSAARPRVEAWPFTTLTPHLGVMRAGEVDVVLADVPGLVEGASEGRGLGHRFLRHVERCAAFVHVLDTISDEPERDPIHDLEVVLRELEAHDASMVERPAVIALNKVDIPDGREMAQLVRPELEARGYDVFEISALTGDGLDPLRWRLAELVRAAREAAPSVDELEAQPQLITYDLDEDRGFEVGRDDAGRYVVTGRRIRRWVQMLPSDNPDALRYLQGRLRRAGIERALIDAGARAGDDVVIGGAVFEFTPEFDDLPEGERRDPADDDWVEGEALEVSDVVRDDGDLAVADPAP